MSFLNNTNNRVISRAILVGIAAVMSMSLFACKPKEKVEKIEIPLEKNLNNNETKVKETMETVIKKEVETKMVESKAEETKKEETKAVETKETEQNTTSQSEYFEKWWIEQQKKKQEPKPETDAMGRPYLKKGQDFTFKDNGMGEPVEAPYSGRFAVNPNTGVKYIYLSTGKWIVDTKEEDDRIAKDYMDGKVDLKGNPVQKRKLTEEEAREIAKMYSNSFK